MENFIFQNPTRLIFGRGMIASLTKEIPADKKIMITFGGGSVKKNGVYDQVISALKGHQFVEFWGIEPNPTVETLRKAVELGRREQVDFLLAVGGGSVLDGTKLIGGAMLYEGDAWDLVRKGHFSESLPVASVLTLPATGSEMNYNGVISCRETQEKYAFVSVHPVFSILDPEVTYSLPKHQLACGLADTFVHVMEQYMTCPVDQSRLMDRWAEGILMSLTEIAPQIIAMRNAAEEGSEDTPIDEQTKYNLMADFMLCATTGLNGFIAMGVRQDWATHMIGHEITALTGLTHGETLAIVLPALLRTLLSQKRAKLLRFAERVFGVSTGTLDNRALTAISHTEEFFRSLGLRTRLTEAMSAEEADRVINEIATRFTERGVAFGEDANVDGAMTRTILEAAK